MPLHRLTHVTIGVPNVGETSRYYTDFGLTPLGDGGVASADGGEQLRIVHAPRPRLVELGVGAEAPDDLAAAADRLSRQGFAYTAEGAQVVATEPTKGASVILAQAPRLRRRAEAAEQSNGPGGADRTG